MEMFNFTICSWYGITISVLKITVGSPRLSAASVIRVSVLWHLADDVINRIFGADLRLMVRLSGDFSADTQLTVPSSGDFGAGVLGSIIAEFQLVGLGQGRNPRC